MECTTRGAKSFCALDAAALENLDTLGGEVHLESRVRLIEEGATADYLYVVCSGRLKLVATNEQGQSLLLRIAGPADVLGLAAILWGTPYEASAESMEPCRLKRIARQDFLNFMKQHSQVGQNCANEAALEYQQAMMAARRLALSGSAAAKLANTLIEWVRPETLDAPIRFIMSLTHEELGSMAAISRETTTRLLSRFEREKLIVRRGAMLEIPDPARLAALAE